MDLIIECDIQLFSQLGKLLHLSFKWYVKSHTNLVSFKFSILYPILKAKLYTTLTVYLSYTDQC